MAGLWEGVRDILDSCAMITPSPSIVAPSVYFDAPTTPDPMADAGGASHLQDAKPKSSTAAHTDPSPEYARAPDTKVAARPERPTIDTNAPKTQHERAATAESSIPHSATSRLTKKEVEDAKRVSKVLKSEGRTDTKVLKAALTELERLQRLHKDAAKDEAAALSSHGKAIKFEHKMKMRFLDAQAKQEAAAADLKAREAALAATKEHLRKQAELLHDKEAEIEEMRGRKAVDDREREVKLKQLTMSPTNVSPA